ncbi:MAG: DUF3352 domain-containing protein, partial [Bacteroidetes bacterium]|nr:DUF3352 domain-containing protein [Bacteroidota bacterium]
MNRFLAASVIGLLLLAIFATGVYFYQRYSIILLDPLRAVPADAAVILEIKKPAESLQDFFSGELRKSLHDDPWIAAAEKNFMLFDSLLKETGAVSEIWEDQTLVISTHLVKAGRFDFLYLLNLPRGWTEQKLKRFIEEGWKMPDQIRKREYENVNIYESRLNDSTIFTFASSKSVAIFSISPLLVEQAIRQLKDGNGIALSKSFLKVVPPAGVNAVIHLYYNNQALKEIATSISPDYDNGFFKMASSFARWNGFAIESENSFLSLRGNTVTFDTTNFLSFFSNQRAQPLNASVVAPSRTALLFQFGISNLPAYFSHLRSNSGFALSEQEKKQVLKDLQSSFNISFETSFTSWVGNEIALIITEPAGNSIDNNIYLCIKASNQADAVNQLNGVRDAVAKEAGLAPSQESYRNYTISSINVKGILPLIFGKLFSGLNGCCYTSLNDYIVFSNQNAALKSLIDENSETKVLSKDPLYNNAAGLLGPTGNVRLYVNPQLSVNLYRPAELQSFLSTIYGSTAIHAQWDYKGAVLRSQMHFDFHKKTMKEPVLFWSAQLDTVLSSVPVTVKENNGLQFVYVQDAKNSLYKLDESGNIVWKKSLEEKILSQIYPIDIYRDGSKQILFNTPSRLFLLNDDGNNAGNYPIRLPATATNGCSMNATSYGYNFYVACSNHYIYAYEAGGKPVADWNYLRTEKNVSRPIQVFTTPENTYLVINEDSGIVLVTDKKGSQQISFAGKFTQALYGQSFSYQNDSAGNIKWITTDTTGSLILFSNDGTTNKVKSGNFTSDHRFFYAGSYASSNVESVILDNSHLFLLNSD